jgi:hypothetical protein
MPPRLLAPAARSALRTGALLLSALLTPLGGAAQDPGPPVPLRLSGTLLVAGTPADTGTVILHRVTLEEAGAADSVRIGPGGAFSFALPEPPGPAGSMYFATHRLDGVAFFGPPVTTAERLDEPYEVRAWPSRTLPAEGAGFRVHVRNLFIEEGPDGWRVTDVFEVGHEDPWSWTSPDPEARVPVWSYPLPESARNLQAAETEMDPGSLRLDRGALEVLAPFPPGERLFVVRYDLPSIEATFPMPGRTGVVELLVREPAPAITIRGLRGDAPVEIERGSVYRRWWAEDVADIAPSIVLGEEAPPNPAWAGILVALLLVALGSVFVGMRTRSTGAPAPAGAEAPLRGSGAGGRRRGILLRIAALDEDVASGRLDPGEGARRRAELLRSLEEG